MAFLRRRNSISSVVPTKLNLQPMGQQSCSFPSGNKPFPGVDFELVSISSAPQSYTSLKDLLPSSPNALNSPTGIITQSCHEICIRNRLVKQAAWAYLQPMASSTTSDSRDFFHRVWVRLSAGKSYFRNPVNSCLNFINLHVIPTITRAFDRLLGAIWAGKKTAVR